jgi:tetratricopeptide (TPR) repeat protein
MAERVKVGKEKTSKATKLVKSANNDSSTSKSEIVHSNISRLDAGQVYYATVKQWQLAGVTFLLALLGYLPTLAQTVTLVDSGELIVASARLGVAHPPGFPLYLLCGFLASKIPWGSIAQRFSLLSAVFAALVAAVTSLIVMELINLMRNEGARPAVNFGNAVSDNQKVVAGGEVATSRFTLAALMKELLPVATGVTVAYSVTLWFYATVAEVYTLNLALLAVVIYAMLGWWREAGKLELSTSKPPSRNKVGSQKELTQDLTRQDVPAGLLPDATTLATPAAPPITLAAQYLLAAALLYGLALGVHHVTILLAAPMLLALVLVRQGKHFWRQPTTAVAILLAVVGMMIYSYLPLAASREPLLNWGDPDSWQRFYWHVSARQYQANVFAVDRVRLGQQISYFLTLFWRQFTPLGLPLAALGLITLWRRQPALLACWGLLLVCDIGYGLIYDIAEDKDAYYLPTLLTLGVMIGLGLQVVLQWALAQRREALRYLCLGLMLALPLVNVFSHYQESNKRHYQVARAFVENTLQAVAPGGMLLTLEWQFYSPFLYLHHLENLRPDVTVIDVNLVRRSWYIRGYLRARYPELMQACQSETEEFLADLDQFEQQLPYDGARIQQRFVNLINALIKHYQQQQRAVHLMLPMEAGVATAYNWVPQGLTMRLYQDKEFHAAEPAWDFSSLTDPRVQLDEVAATKVKGAYALMLINRARYLLIVGKQAAPAIERLRQAIELDSTLDKAYEILGDAYVVQGNVPQARDAYRQAVLLNPENRVAQQRLDQLITGSKNTTVLSQ